MDRACLCFPGRPQNTQPPDLARQRLAHNCSGKHAGFLTLARHGGHDIDTYLDVEGPIQRQVLEAIADTCALRRSDLVVEMDGCGAPVVCLKIGILAVGLGRILDAGPSTAEATLLDAMAQHPDLVAGRGRFDTLVAAATNGEVLTKVGAGGVHVAYLRDVGVAIVVKVVDGDRVAAEVALAYAVAELSAGRHRDALVDLAERPVVTDEGEVIGAVRVSAVR